jgi:hypothetical protein
MPTDDAPQLTASGAAFLFGYCCEQPDFGRLQELVLRDDWQANSAAREAIQGAINAVITDEAEHARDPYRDRPGRRNLLDMRTPEFSPAAAHIAQIDTAAGQFFQAQSRYDRYCQVGIRLAAFPKTLGHREDADSSLAKLQGQAQEVAAAIKKLEARKRRASKPDTIKAIDDELAGVTAQQQRLKDQIAQTREKLERWGIFLDEAKNAVLRAIKALPSEASEISEQLMQFINLLTKGNHATEALAAFDSGQVPVAVMETDSTAALFEFLALRFRDPPPRSKNEARNKLIYAMYQQGKSQVEINDAISAEIARQREANEERWPHVSSNHRDIAEKYAKAHNLPLRDPRKRGPKKKLN